MSWPRGLTMDSRTIGSRTHLSLRGRWLSPDIVGAAMAAGGIAKAVAISFLSGFYETCPPEAGKLRPPDGGLAMTQVKVICENQ